MTMCAEKGITISTVIVIAAIGHLFFQHVRRERRCIAKTAFLQLQAWHFDSQSARCKGTRVPLNPPKALSA